MSKIFISYRRDDSAGYAHAVYRQLVQNFSKDRLFMDVDTLEPGVDFVRVIEEAVSECDVLIALIGKRWANVGSGATSRLNDPEDFVSLEISTALARDIPVIPVLLDNVTMPSGEILPTSLKPLSRRNAIEISNTRFNFDVERLITTVRKILDAAEAKRKADEENRRRIEEERNRAEQEQLHIEAEARHRKEEQLREQQRQRAEAREKAQNEERRRVEEQKNRARQEEERRRLEAEAQRKAEEEPLRKQERQRAEQENNYSVSAERTPSWGYLFVLLSYPWLHRRHVKYERTRASVRKEVHLGSAAPSAVCPGEEFVARFAAYTEAYRNEVGRIIAQEAPSAQPRLDLETCRWHPGAKVTVRLDAHSLEISNPIQTFKWNGTQCVLRFDVKVPVNIAINTIILRFDIAVEGLPIVAIRPEIAVSRKKKENETISSVSAIAPSSAFASYAKKDRRDVLGRVRSLQIFTGIDVFLDCLSIRPSEEWKSKLKKEIHERDIFWLFWSRSAMASEWVEWEWRTALAEKSLAKIQPHPLEPSELAPPPKELSSLQFGAMYEWYVSQLRESPITRVFRPLFHNAASFYEAYRRWCFAVAVAIIIGAFAWYIYSFAF